MSRNTAEATVEDCSCAKARLLVSAKASARNVSAIAPRIEAAVQVQGRKYGWLWLLGERERE